jgi:hypothetical protein
MQHWEFLNDPLYGIGAYKDDQGRPIGERNAPAEAMKGVPLVLRECPYRDSRFKHELPMNVSALKQVRQYWLPVLDDVRALRHEYLERYPCSPPDMLDLWKMSRMITVVPTYLARRRRAQFTTGQIPAEIAALYKIVLGVYQTFDVMLVQATIAGQDIHMQVTPALMIRHIEAQKLFVSPHGVCGGPMPMVEEILSVVIYGTGDEENASEIKEFIAPLDEFFEYSALETLLQLAKYIYLVNSYNMAEEFFAKVSDLRREPWGQDDATARRLERLSGLAADYQPNTKITQMLRQIPREYREELLTNLFKVLNSYEYEQLQTESIELLRRPAHSAARDEADALAGRLAEMRAASDYADARVREALLSHLAEYVNYERRALEAFTMLQAAVDVSLGYEKSAEAVDSACVREAFGQTVADLLAEPLGVSFKNHPRQTIIRCGELEGSFTADERPAPDLSLFTARPA